jgi:hypothetical protein
MTPPAAPAAQDAAPAASLEMFECLPLRSRMSRVGCARMWTSSADPARRPDPYEDRYACLGCPVGAIHAGQDPKRATEALAAEALRRFCPRCERYAARMIRRALCVSCYNRQREVRIGRNAKGNRPVEVAARFGTMTVAVDGLPDQAAGAAPLARSREVVSRTEALLRAARAARGRGRPLFGLPRFPGAAAPASPPAHGTLYA